MSKFTKLSERLQSLKSTPSNVFFKPPYDKKVTIRIVPNPHADKSNIPLDKACFVVDWHYNIAGHRSLVCPGTYGESCPICDLAEEIRLMGGKDNWNIFRKLQAKMRIYSIVLVRGKEEDGIKLWGYGVTISDGLSEKFDDPDWGNIASPTTGRDIKVWSVKAKTAANESDFDKPKMDVLPTQSKLFEKKEDIIKLLEDIPNYLNPEEGPFKIMTNQELRDIVAKLANEPTEESASYEEDLDDVTNEDSDDQFDDLSNELDDILGDLD